MKFRVHGLHLDTGEELDLVIEAPHPMAAAEKAQAMRVAVGTMDVEGAPSSTEIRVVQAPPVQQGYAAPARIPTRKEGSVGKGLGLGFGAAIGWTTGLIATVVVGFVAMVFICGGLMNLGRSARAPTTASSTASQTAQPAGPISARVVIEEVKLLGVAEFGHSWERVSWRVRIKNNGPPAEANVWVNLCDANGTTVLTAGPERMSLPTGTTARSFSTQGPRGAAGGAASACSVAIEER